MKKLESKIVVVNSKLNKGFVSNVIDWVEKTCAEVDV